MDFLRQIRTRGWQSTKAEKPEDRERSSWISPNGDWYNVPFADHPIFAKYVIRDLYPAYKDMKIRECGFTLIHKFNWLSIHHDWSVGTVISDFENMTPDQYVVLYEFFGNETLFRGWTIKSMWKKSKFNDTQYLNTIK